MPRTVHLDIHPVTRVEGHGQLVVRASDGRVERAEWLVPEAPRFFEAMVRARRWDEIQPVVSRVCGICSISHSLAAVKAVEEALGVAISDDARMLRVLTHYSELLQSHVLHVGYLVAPDLMGAPSVVPLAQTNLDLVKKVVGLHRAANEWSDLLAGRTTHPLTLVPGGFTRVPAPRELEGLRRRLAGLVPMATELAEAVLAVAGSVPSFHRDTEYVALRQAGEYAFTRGDIASSDTDESRPAGEFESVANEYVTPQSTAKWTRWHRDSYAVGALARYNLNRAELLPLASKWAGMFGLGGHCDNPYMNSVAQLVECAQILEDSQRILDSLAGRDLKDTRVEVHPAAGEGASAVEAPRGILFHRYAFDEKGVCQSANLCIPTNQNHGNLQKDIESLVPGLLHLGQDEIRLRLEMLVRAYDPCISCSTHFLKVRFI